MPLTSNGIICGAVDSDFLYVGGGDGKVKKVALAGGQWTLTHEAQLDSRVMSVNSSIGIVTHQSHFSQVSANDQ